MIQRIQNYDLNKLIKNKDCTWWIEVMRWRTKQKNKTLQHRHLCKKTLHQRHKLISERTYKYFKSTLTSSHRMKKKAVHHRHPSRHKYWWFELRVIVWRKKRMIKYLHHRHTNNHKLNQYQREIIKTLYALDIQASQCLGRLPHGTYKYSQCLRWFLLHTWWHQNTASHTSNQIGKLLHLHPSRHTFAS